MDFFHLSKDNCFGLSYPSLQQRQEKFTQICLNEINYWDKIRVFQTINFGQNSYSELRYLILLNNPTERVTHNSQFLSNGRLESALVNLFRNSLEAGYEFFLYVLNRFLQGINGDIENKQLENIEKPIIDLIARFDLDYFWNEETKSIERVIDKTNTLIINENIKKLPNTFGYNDCIDEFLKPNIKKNYLQSLDHLKRVLERVLGLTDLRLHKTKSLRDSIVGIYKGHFYKVEKAS